MTFQLKNLDSFIDDNKGRLEQRDFDKSYKIWSGFYIVAQLENLGLGPKFFPDLKVQSHDLLLILILWAIYRILPIEFGKIQIFFLKIWQNTDFLP